MRIPGVPFVQGRNDYTDSDGRKYGIAIHNTSNDASDEGEANYAKRRTDGVSSHLYVDDDSVTQSLDTEDRAGHAGSAEGNNHALAVEITGSNGKSRAWWLANVAWDKLGRALAYVITHDRDYRGFQVRRASVAEMRSNPRVKAFYGHDDMRRAWGGTTHTDPGPNFPWDRLFQAVNAALAGEDDDMQEHERIALHVTNWRTDALVRGLSEIQIPALAGTSFKARTEPNAVAAAQRTMLANLAELRGKDFVDEDQVVEGVLSGLGGVDLDKAAAALRAAFGDRIGELAAKLATPQG